ncbi:MAG: hypothetical protein WA771_10045 [Chthoniobacterales bacterium]
MIGLRGITSAVAATVFLLAAATSRGAEDIKVPFNFRWGDPPSLVESTVTKAKAKVVGEREIDGRNAIIVEGHPDPRLERSIFYFVNDALAEVELQYADKSWDTQKLNAIFEQTRRNLDRKYGTSRNIARTNTVEEGVKQTVLGYQWTQSYTSLRLFLYLAQKDAKTFRMLSYHYRGY